MSATPEQLEKARKKRWDIHAEVFVKSISDRRRDAIAALRRVSDDTRVIRRFLAESYPNSGIQQAPYDLVVQSLDHTIALAEKMGLILTDEN